MISYIYKTFINNQSKGSLGYHDTEIFNNSFITAIKNFSSTISVLSVLGYTNKINSKLLFLSTITSTCLLYIFIRLLDINTKHISSFSLKTATLEELDPEEIENYKCELWKIKSYWNN